MKFQKGQSGNPLGREKGSRNKLQEQFWEDFAAAWDEHGADALKHIAKEDRATFVKVAASVMPKEQELTIRQERMEELTDDELAAIIRDTQRLIAGAASDRGRGATKNGSKLVN